MHEAQLLAKDNLAAVVAFHKWRHHALRSSCKAKVQEALEVVAEEEEQQRELQDSLNELSEKCACMHGVQVRGGKHRKRTGGAGSEGCARVCMGVHGARPGVRVKVRGLTPRRGAGGKRRSLAACAYTDGRVIKLRRAGGHAKTKCERPDPEDISAWSGTPTAQTVCPRTWTPVVKPLPWQPHEEAGYR